jgi:hypothetical protein
MTEAAENLGLNTLTDDQLVEFARALAGELARRNPAVVDAAKAAVAAATARAANDQDVIWTTKKWLAKMVDDHIDGSGWTLAVWRASGREETRVYLEMNGQDRRGRENHKYCLHVTGGKSNAPDEMTVEIGSRAEKIDTKLARLIMKHAFNAFPAGEKIDVNKCCALKYAVPAEPDDVAAYVNERAAAQARSDARNAYRLSVEQPLRNIENDLVRKLVDEHIPTDVEAWRRTESFLPAQARDEIASLRASHSATVSRAMAAYDAEHGAP